MAIPPVYVIGYPGDVGGACTETWHTVKLWRRYGVEVTCTPTWKPEATWQHRLADIGVKTLVCKPAELGETIPADSIVAAFCSHPFLYHVGVLRRLGCRLIWVPCMTHVYEGDRECHEEHGPFDRYVFQSRYQTGQLWPEYQALGAVEGTAHRIPGAFDVEEFPYLPKTHRNGDSFVVGRISRPDQRKFSDRTWEIYGGIPNVRARVLGWNKIVQQKLIATPSWAECLPTGAESTLAFLRSLHAVVHAGGEAVENWPRFVLEAMAAGVPVITDNRGGTREMIAHGTTGYLCDTAAEMTVYARELAEREDKRLTMASAARTAVEELCEPGAIWEKWRVVFESL